MENQSPFYGVFEDVVGYIRLYYEDQNISRYLTWLDSPTGSAELYLSATYFLD